MKPVNTISEASEILQSTAEIPVWERLPEEPPKWFVRFNIFRLFGNERSIDTAWRHENRTKTNKNGRAPDSWHKAAKRFDWRERAFAWDIAETERLWQHIVAERDRRMGLALQSRKQREGYLIGLDRTLRSYAEKLRNHDKLDAEKQALSVAWTEARLQVHFDSVERIIRLCQTEFASEEKILTEMAVRQQQCAAQEQLSLQEEHNYRTRRLGQSTPTRVGLVVGDTASEKESNNALCLRRQHTV